MVLATAIPVALDSSPWEVVIYTLFVPLDQTPGGTAPAGWYNVVSKLYSKMSGCQTFFNTPDYLNKRTTKVYIDHYEFERTMSRTIHERPRTRRSLESTRPFRSADEQG